MTLYMYDDFNITRNADGSDFTINHDDDKKSKQDPKKPKTEKPGNSSGKKGGTQKTNVRNDDKQGRRR